MDTFFDFRYNSLLFEWMVGITFIGLMVFEVLRFTQQTFKTITNESFRYERIYESNVVRSIFIFLFSLFISIFNFVEIHRNFSFCQTYLRLWANNWQLFICRFFFVSKNTFEGVTMLRKILVVYQLIGNLM